MIPRNSSKRQVAVLFAFILIFVLLTRAVSPAVAELEAPPIPSTKENSAKPEPRLTDAEAQLSNNLLRIYISERNSRVWEYQYAPGLWGESNFHEHFAIYTPAAGIVESEDLLVDQGFSNPGGGTGSVTGRLSNSQFSVTRSVIMPPGNARYFRIDYDIANKTGSTVQDVRFFQAIDFDIPRTGDHTDDYGWYDPTTDYIGVRDDSFFRNILVSTPRSDNHSVDWWNWQIYVDWDDGNLSGRNSYGPGDPAVAKQFNLGNLSPGQSRHVAFYVWFGDPTTTGAEACLRGRAYGSAALGLPGAIVKLIHQTTLAETSATANANGDFQIENLAPGRYSVNIGRDGYTPYTTILTLAGGVCEQLSPRLHPVETSELIDLAEEVAPDIYQDTDNRNVRADFFTRANYDGNWNGLDNWQNLNASPLQAYVYWDAASSQTHHFLKYYLFYPQDWGDVFPLNIDRVCTTEGEGQSNRLCHENDLEGFAIAVNRQTNQVEYMVLRQHGLPPTKCSEDNTTGKPTKIEAQRLGHATSCLHEFETIDFPGGDGVVYRYGDTAEVPVSHTDDNVLYDLIHVNDLRAIRGTAEGVQAFTPNDKNFRGNDYGENKASTPWGLSFWWHVPDNRQAALHSEAITYQGDLFADPARVFASMFPQANISTEYTFNPNLTASTEYVPTSGGWATTPAGEASVFLPFGSTDVAATVTLSYDVPDNLPVTNPSARTGEEVVLVGRPFNFSVSRNSGGQVTAFNAPVRVEVSYSASDLEALGVSEQNLRVVRWDGNAWRSLPTEVDPGVEMVSAYTAVPGVYALFTGELRTVNIAPIFLPIALQIPYVPPVLPLLNGNFEAGATGWTESSAQGWRIIVNSNEVDDLPTHSGIWVAWLGGDDNEIAYIQQEVTVSPDRPYLTYYYAIASEDFCGYDFGGLLVNNVVVDQYNLCEAANTPNWARRTVNLSAYAGQTVRLQIRAETDDSLNSNLLVDDVAFSGSAAAAAEPTVRITGVDLLKTGDRNPASGEAVRRLGPER